MSLKNKVESVELSVPKNYFQSPIKLLLWMGISLIPIKEPLKRFFYSIYAVSLILLTVYIFLVIELLDCLVVNVSVDSITFGLSYGVTHILGAAKVALFLIKRNAVVSMMQKIQSGIFAPDIKRGGPQEYHLINDAVRRSENQGYIFFGFATVIISLRGIYAMLDSGTDVEYQEGEFNTTYTKHIRTMPYTTWFPFDKNEQPYYAIGFTYQIFSTYIYGLFIGATDAILCGFMMHIVVQFKILKLSLNKLIERSKSSALDGKAVAMYENVENVTLWKGCEKKPLLSNPVNAEVEKFAKKIVYHHQEIVNLCTQIEDEICYLMLLQFLSSLFIICFQFFQISSTSPKSIEFLSMSLYLTLMLYQLLNYCYNGNEVMIVSDSLPREIFAIDWLILDETVKKYLLLMMMRAQRPSIFTAGKFAMLSLQTYMTIVRGSGSYFMVLRQMNN